MDQWLEDQQEGRVWRIKAVARVAQGVVDFSRWYLTQLLKAGSWISATFSRQMEYDADRYETAMVGPEVFEQTSRTLPLLQIAQSIAWQDTGVVLRECQLPDNMPALIAGRVGTIADESVDSIIAGALQQKTGRFDSHPCMSDRIASSRRFGTPGIFQLDAPATALFADFDGL